MKTFYLSFFLLALAFSAAAQSSYVQLSTSKGNIIVVLYDETPKHRDNFLKAIRTGTFRDQEFNRVIKGFVSQGGELDETILDREKLHPEVPLQRIAAEIKPQFYHKKGALGAGRNDNPEKSSYLDQIYLVEGKKQTDAALDLIEKKTGRHFSAAQRDTYKTIGGTPGLDGDYTIFGEVVSGLSVAEAINAVPAGANDRPRSPVTFKLHILSKKEIKALAH
jgi:cyclophilin family peptidyl-prolyl cis-trans isomerase